MTIKIDYEMLIQQYGNNGFGIEVIPSEYRKHIIDNNPANLTDKERAVIQLKILNKWTGEQLSVLFHCTPRSIWKTIRSAKQKINDYINM